VRVRPLLRIELRDDPRGIDDQLERRRLGRDLERLVGRGDGDPLLVGPAAEVDGQRKRCSVGLAVLSYDP